MSAILAVYCSSDIQLLLTLLTAFHFQINENEVAGNLSYRELIS